jgi:hypothetical protein
MRSHHRDLKNARVAISQTATPSETSDARDIETRIQALSPDESLERYHQLVDRRLLGTLQFTELFELGCIEARLNADDRAEMDRVTELHDAWRRERNGLIASIEGLLAGLKAEH